MQGAAAPVSWHGLKPTEYATMKVSMKDANNGKSCNKHQFTRQKPFHWFHGFIGFLGYAEGSWTMISMLRAKFQWQAPHPCENINMTVPKNYFLSMKEFLSANQLKRGKHSLFIVHTESQCCHNLCKLFRLCSVH